MNRSTIGLIAAAAVLLFSAVGCDKGIDDWSSSAKLSGYVYTDASRTVGQSGVQVIFESDPEADNPYEGPDRWTVTDENGYFEGYVFLGNKYDESASGGYNYVADMSVGYFYSDRSFSWSGGVTVAPGSHFTLPTVDLSQFGIVTNGGD